MHQYLLRLMGRLVTLLRGNPLARFRFVKKIYYAIYARLRPSGLTKVTVPFGSLLVDPQDEGLASFLITTGQYEPFETHLICSVLENGDCALDIGANIGYHTIVMAQKVGPKGRVISLEPGPENFSLLQRNIALNDLSDRVEAHACAAGAEEGVANLFKNPRNLGDHSLFSVPEECRESVSVRVCPVDSLVPTATPIKVLKLDVQGAEYLALQGLRRVLCENPTVHVFVEFWPDALRRSNTDPQAFINDIASLGFGVYMISEGKQSLFPIVLDDLRTMAQTRQEFNLLLLRPSVDLAEAMQ